MSHEISYNNGQYSFAKRAGSAATWHGLGQEFEDSDTLEIKAQKAGLAYIVQRGKVRYATSAAGDLQEWPSQHVLFRSDSKAPLGIVSDKFKIHHQPTEALALIEQRAEKIGAHLDTAMALKGGALIVATASLPAEHAVAKCKDDKVRASINYASAFDGSMKTTEWFSSTRIVCWNTLRVALGEGAQYKTSHRANHDQAAADAALGLAQFAEQMRAADEMAKFKLTTEQTYDYLAKAYTGLPLAEAQAAEATAKAVDRMLLRLIPQINAAPGAQLATASGTLWGALNAVTHDVDHVGTARSGDARAVSAMFNGGARVKAQAWAVAQQMLSA